MASRAVSRSLRHPSHPNNMPYSYASGRFSRKGRKSDKVRTGSYTWLDRIGEYLQPICF
jgi:hypothetical protein